MPASLTNTTVTTNLKDTVLGGSGMYGSGILIIGNNPVQIEVTSGPEIGVLHTELYPYVAPSIIPLVIGAPRPGGKPEYINQIRIAAFNASLTPSPQVAGWLLEPDLAGLGPANAFTGTISASGSISSGVSTPSGTILPYAGATAPPGFVLCDGSTYDGTQSTYLNLWNVIGTTYGGSGQNAFIVPDLRGRVPVGKGTNGSVNALNTNDGQAVANRRPQHRHTPHSHTINGGSSDFITSPTGTDTDAGGGTTLSRVHTTDTKDGGSGNANDALDTPSFIVINYIIAL